jgi:cytochrome b subunit of formate dehydrogenase
MGVVDSPARCGRYIYKEKFIYWLILLGGIQMIVTGIVLWFPVAMTKYTPGQIIPVSKIIHTNEAMLIFLVIVVWHIYDSVLNPEVFPINESIFTGYIKKSRMQQEHPLELIQHMEADNIKTHE